MGLTKIELFCAGLSAGTGAEITYKPLPIGSELPDGLDGGNLQFYLLYFNDIIVNDYYISDYILANTMSCEERNSDGTRTYLTFEVYIDVVSTNIASGTYISTHIRF